MLVLTRVSAEAATWCRESRIWNSGFAELRTHWTTETEKMWFTFQAGLRDKTTVQDQHSSRARWGAPGVPQNQMQSRAFQWVFLTCNGITCDFLGCHIFYWHVFPLNIFSDSAMSVFFDLLISDSFNNRCEFLFRKQRETLEFIFRERKSNLELGEEINCGIPREMEETAKEDENNSL